ncbi:hypothetical protein AVEN_130906-1 [Araneus ventricosus]|uniref:Uncharacterized protein n=1 Tax=Araneus ventricosus TaxID=182803 RepID=A0A4Y2V410_ARAVE|nr:hypothetical protein AVEN_130906-1 [Araneus ventricosus]
MEFFVLPSSSGTESWCCVFFRVTTVAVRGLEPGTFGSRAEHPNHQTRGIRNVQRWILAYKHHSKMVAARCTTREMNAKDTKGKRKPQFMTSLKRRI